MDSQARTFRVFLHSLRNSPPGIGYRPRDRTVEPAQRFPRLPRRNSRSKPGSYPSPHQGEAGGTRGAVTLVSLGAGCVSYSRPEKRKIR